MYETKYHRASTVSDAAAMLKNADDGKLLSGGQTLIPTMKQRLAAPSDLIDLRHIDEISGITKQADGSIRIGAATCHADVLAMLMSEPHFRDWLIWLDISVIRMFATWAPLAVHRQQRPGSGLPGSIAGSWCNHRDQQAGVYRKGLLHRHVRNSAG